MHPIPWTQDPVLRPGANTSPRGGRAPRLGALVLLIAGGALSMSACSTATTSGLAEAPRSREFEFRYEAVVREVPESARTGYLWIPLPAEGVGQEIEDLEVASPMPHGIVTEPRYGNRALRFSLVPGRGVQEVVLTFRVRRGEQVRRPVGPPRPRERPSPEELQLWLGPDRRVPIDGQIRTWAEETVSGASTDLEKARAIYDYVVTNLRYDKSGSGWGQGDIYWACDEKRGNCTDFHSLFIGYSRAVGIPATFEMGFPIPPDRGSGEIAGYHCWSRFFLDGYGWIPVDASEAHKQPGRREYFFGAHDENRVLFTVGRDLVLPGMHGGPLNFFIYPYAEVDGAPHASVDRNFSYRDVAPG